MSKALGIFHFHYQSSPVRSTSSSVLLLERDSKSGDTAEFKRGNLSQPRSETRSYPDDWNQISPAGG